MTRMRILVPGRTIDLPIHGPDDASLIGRHWNAVQHFLATGEVAGLDEHPPMPATAQHAVTATTTTRLCIAHLDSASHSGVVGSFGKSNGRPYPRASNIWD